MLNRITLSLLLAIGAISCSSSCGAGPAVTRQEPAAVACLPLAISSIMACSAAHDHACVVTAIGTLLVCWATHQAPPSDALPNVPAAGSSG